MTDSPPRTPLSSHRVQHAPLSMTLTPQQFSDNGNDENALNFANTPRNGNGAKVEHTIVYDNDLSSIGNDGIQSFDSNDGASEVSVARLKGWLDDFGKQNHAHYVKNNPEQDTSSSIQGAPSIDSDGDSDLSVSRLKDWLGEFGKQNRAHYDKVNHVGKVPDGVSLAKPVRVKSANTPSSKPMVPPPPTIRRNTDPTILTATEAKKGPAKTPVRVRSRFKKDEVQATNDGYASVKKIAAWLADDPTADKKMTTVRKGINVINKSRMFEKDLENVIIEENRIVKGSVSNKKDFFQAEAFADDDDGKCETASCVSVSDKKKWLEGAFGTSTRQDDANGDDDDSIVSMSVLDKKQWLQNAFKTADGRRSTSTTPSRFKSAASAPGGPSMVPQRNEAAVLSVKQKFQNRAASRRSLLDTSHSSETRSSHSPAEATVAKHKWQQRAARRSSLSGPTESLESHTEVASTQSSGPDEVPELTGVEEPCEPPAIERLRTVASSVSPVRNNVARKWQERKVARQSTSPQRPVLERMISSGSSRGSVASPARTDVAKKWKERQLAKQAMALNEPSKSSQPDVNDQSKADEEETFDFRAAREKLVKRSAQNGNPVKVINKVYLRKQKFEKIEAEARKQADPMGLLKPTWEQANPEVGPTTSYTKSFVDNVAPKKSFDELP